MRMFYIYGLVCPIDGCIKYIGKTENRERRLACHLSETKFNPKKRRWMKSIKKLGLRPSLVTISENDCYIDASLEEEMWIKAYNYFGAKLLNYRSTGKRQYIPSRRKNYKYRHLLIKTK
jgi:hypothetical protein